MKRHTLRFGILLISHVVAVSAGLAHPGGVQAAQAYQRSPENAARFAKAEKAAAEHDPKGAARLLRAIVAADSRDYESWAELGTALFTSKDANGAEEAYKRCLDIQPDYPLAMLNLGKLDLQRRDFESAVRMLSRLVEKQPQMAEAQYHLGEAYLQVLKGSLAIVHFNEAIRLDPIGMAEAHLRLAALYHAAGFRDRAAGEYEKFLAKKPDCRDRKKLLKYIRENMKHDAGSPPELGREHD